MSKVSNFKEILNKYEYFDIHAHVNSDPLLSQSDLVIQTCQNASVMFNNAGSDLQDSLVGINQAKQNENVFAMIGVHPMCIEDDKTPQYYYDALEKMYLANQDYVLCIGEIGLEKTDVSKFNKQKEVFIKLLDLARKYQLPVELHIRNAHEEAIPIIEKYGKGLKLLVHCFALNYEYAQRYLNLGCWLSVNGIITFKKKNDDVLAALPKLPHDRLLIETDSPYLTPVPYRGKINTPKYVVLVFQKLQQLWDISEEELKEQLKKNALAFFSK